MQTYDIKKELNALLAKYSDQAKQEWLDFGAETWGSIHSDDKYADATIEERMGEFWLRFHAALLGRMTGKSPTWSGGAYSATNACETIDRDTVVTLYTETQRDYAQTSYLKRVAARMTKLAAERHLDPTTS